MTKHEKLAILDEFILGLVPPLQRHDETPRSWNECAMMLNHNVSARYNAIREQGETQETAETAFPKSVGMSSSFEDTPWPEESAASNPTNL